jgi:hypothetical protein
VTTTEQLRSMIAQIITLVLASLDPPTATGAAED